MSLNVLIRPVLDYSCNCLFGNAKPTPYLLVGILACCVSLPDLMHRILIELRKTMALGMFYLRHGFEVSRVHASYISVPLVKTAVMEFYSGGQRPFIAFVYDGVRMMAASVTHGSAVPLARQASLPNPTSAVRIFDVLHSRIPAIVSRDKTFGFAFQILGFGQVCGGEGNNSFAPTKTVSTLHTALQALSFIIGADLGLHRFGHILAHCHLPSRDGRVRGASNTAGPFALPSIIPNGAAA